jgi:dTMP kinase
VQNSLQHLKSFYITPETPESYFLSLEGIEGSGKSTQIKFLEKILIKKGYRVLSLREPGGTEFGERLREAILKSSTPLHPLAECHLFLASRAQLLKEKILPFLLQPKSIVILDRYIDSTLAYQGQARKLGFKTVLELHQHNPLNILPHRTFYLDIPLEVSWERQNLRGQEKDYFESEKADFYNELITGYQQMAGLFSDRILTIDARGSVEEVSTYIEQDIERFIK